MLECLTHLLVARRKADLDWRIPVTLTLIMSLTVLLLSITLKFNSKDKVISYITEQHKSLNYLQVTYCPSSLQIARHLSPIFQSLLVQSSSSCGCSAAKSLAVTSSSTLELPAPPSADFKSRSCVLIRSRVSSITSSRSTFNFRSSSLVGSVVRAASTYKTHFTITYNEALLVLNILKGSMPSQQSTYYTV
jgi:hypothetical protein